MESRGGGVLVEEHVEGPEVTVNAFSREGELRAAHRHGSAHRRSARLRRRARPRLADRHDPGRAIDAARAAVEAVGIRDGPSYTQVRLGADGPVVMEVAARLGGGHDAELCRAATGVDLNALAIAARARRGRATTAQPVARRLAVRGRRGVVFLVAAGRAAGRGRGRRRTRRASPASNGCGSTGGPATSSARSGAAPTARERCSRPAPTATRRWSGGAVRRTPYASGSMRTRRDTPLGFQPPAIGEEEVAAVAETLALGLADDRPPRRAARGAAAPRTSRRSTSSPSARARRRCTLRCSPSASVPATR